MLGEGKGSNNDLGSGIVPQEFQVVTESQQSTIVLQQLKCSPQLSAEEVHAFLFDEKVDVYTVSVVKCTSAGLQVAYEKVASMCRLDFYRRYIMWFAIHVLGLHEHLDFIDDTVSATQLSMAVNKLGSEDNNSALVKLKAYLFRQHDVGHVLTYYAKDGRLVGSPSAKTILRCVVQESQDIRNVLLGDMLPHMGSFDGMTIDQAWTYTGGTTLAGHHVEDAFLKFENLHIRLRWLDPVLWTERSKQALRRMSVSLVEAQSILNTIDRIALKSWLFGVDASTASGIVNTNNIIAAEFDEVAAQDERYMHERVYVLNPDYCTRSYPGVFKEVLVEPGQALLSNASHSVIGFCAFSIAYNVLLVEDVQHCLALEKEMSDRARLYLASSAMARALLEGSGRAKSVNFSLASTMLNKIDLILDSNADRSWLGTKLQTMHKAMRARHWQLVYRPALSSIHNNYIKQHTGNTKFITDIVSSEVPIYCKCGPEFPCRDLQGVNDVIFKRMLDTDTMLCYTCGEACLVSGVIVQAKGIKGRKRTTATRLLCFACFGACRHHTDVLVEANVFTRRSNYEIYTRVLN